MADQAGEPLETTLGRLKKERDEADARYNEALTALDKTLGAPVDLPHPPYPIDEHQITALNESWNILPASPAASGLRRKLTGFIWGVVAPYFQRQLTFNSQLVDHVNRDMAAARGAHQASEATIAALRQQLAANAAFQSRLMLYLQQITAYVDTKDRDSAGGALVLNAALSDLAENLAKRWESLTSREQRYEARTASIAASQEELRAMIGVAQQAITTFKREIERMDVRLKPDATGTKSATESVERDAFAAELDAYKYVGFEDQFRGSREVIRARLETYLPAFDGLSDVLDVGCGRGEFLDLLNAHGISSRGIDLNHEMAEVCRARGLDVTEADAVGYLSSLADASLGGIFAAQVVEHLEPGVPAALSRTLVPEAPSGRAHRARDAEPGLLGRVLRELHPRHHAPLAAPSRNAQVSRRGERLHEGGYRVPLAGAAAGSTPADCDARRRGSCARRSGRGVQQQRPEAERADVHPHGLCNRRAEICRVDRFQLHDVHLPIDRRRLVPAGQRPVRPDAPRAGA